MRTEALSKLMAGGVIPAMPLALTEDRNFDVLLQRRIIRYYLAAGVDGIAVAVHTTQFEIRFPEHNLFETVLKVACDEIGKYEAKTGKTIIRIAGACGTTEQAEGEAKLAKSIGYDAVLLSPGGLSEKSEAYMVDRTQTVASILPVIGFYLQPAVGGRVFSYNYWRKLCDIDNVVAIKCAAFNRYYTLDVMRAVALSQKPIALYTGNDDNIVGDLLTVYRFSEGGKTYTAEFVGGLLGHWAVWTHSATRIFERLMRAKKQGKPLGEELTLAQQVTDANAAFFDVANSFAGCIAGIHEVLRRQGLMNGIWCLNPRETLSPGQALEIDRVYEMYPDLNDDAFVADFLAKDTSAQE